MYQLLGCDVPEKDGTIFAASDDHCLTPRVPVRKPHASELCWMGCHEVWIGALIGVGMYCHPSVDSNGDHVMPPCCHAGDPAGVAHPPAHTAWPSQFQPMPHNRSPQISQLQCRVVITRGQRIHVHSPIPCTRYQRASKHRCVHELQALHIPRVLAQRVSGVPPCPPVPPQPQLIAEHLVQRRPRKHTRWQGRQLGRPATHRPGHRGPWGLCSI
mmetsp:Transcript_3287/g.8812  ORF Transcript_3287/g.8812 Transcript_3287/m.8812 type:complete len:214 (-) Transcript_3287:390-1031(-)